MRQDIHQVAPPAIIDYVTHSRSHTHARMRARTHAHAHIYIVLSLCSRVNMCLSKETGLSHSSLGSWETAINTGLSGFLTAISWETPINTALSRFLTALCYFGYKFN